MIHSNLNKNTIGFQGQIEIDCNLINDSNCWNLIKNKYKLPKRLKKPTCPKVDNYTFKEKMDFNRFYIVSLAATATIETKSILYNSDKIKCELMP